MCQLPCNLVFVLGLNLNASKETGPDERENRNRNLHFLGPAFIYLKLFGKNNALHWPIHKFT